MGKDKCMDSDISLYYYAGALSAAEKGNIDDCILACSIVTGIIGNKEDKIFMNTMRLALICFIETGNYKMADYCLEEGGAGCEDLKSVIQEKRKTREILSSYIEKRRYGRALSFLRKENSMNAFERKCMFYLLCVKRRYKSAVRGGMI